MTDLVDYEKAINRWTKKFGGDLVHNWSNPGYAKEYALAHHEVMLAAPVFQDYAADNIFRTGTDFMFDPDKHELIYAEDRVVEMAVDQEERFILYAEEYVENKINGLIAGSNQTIMIPPRYWYYWKMVDEYVKVLVVTGCAVVGKAPVPVIDTDYIISELLKED